MIENRYTPETKYANWEKSMLPKHSRCELYHSSIVPRTHFHPEGRHNPYSSRVANKAEIHQEPVVQERSKIAQQKQNRPRPPRAPGTPSIPFHPVPKKGKSLSRPSAMSAHFVASSHYHHPSPPREKEKLGRKKRERILRIKTNNSPHSSISQTRNLKPSPHPATPARKHSAPRRSSHLHADRP